MTSLSVQNRTLFPVGNIDAYLAQVNQIPLLTAQEEHDLATQWQQSGNIHAAQKLVLSHIRYVVRISKGYLGYGNPFSLDKAYTIRCMFLQYYYSQ